METVLLLLRPSGRAYILDFPYLISRYIHLYNFHFISLFQTQKETGVSVCSVTTCYNTSHETHLPNPLQFKFLTINHFFKLPSAILNSFEPWQRPRSVPLSPPKHGTRTGRTHAITTKPQARRIPPFFAATFSSIRRRFLEHGGAGGANRVRWRPSEGCLAASSQAPIREKPRGSNTLRPLT